ncbi:MAG: helix-turn-helix transcriptional regulator [Bacteroidia bacterium]|nr:helix-turn-helix transcriptional regulator [Bacteroidia bacterium]
MAKNYFPTNLSFLRTRIKVSQDILANIIGKQRSIIGYYESGKSQPNIDTLLKLADYFGVSLHELITADLTGAIHRQGQPSVDPTLDTLPTPNHHLDYQGGEETPERLRYLQQLLVAKDQVIYSKESENVILKRLIKELDEKIHAPSGH